MSELVEAAQDALVGVVVDRLEALHRPIEPHQQQRSLLHRWRRRAARCRLCGTAEQSDPGALRNALIEAEEGGLRLHSLGRRTPRVTRQRCHVLQHLLAKCEQIAPRLSLTRAALATAGTATLGCSGGETSDALLSAGIQCIPPYVLGPPVDWRSLWWRTAPPLLVLPPPHVAVSGHGLELPANSEMADRRRIQVVGEYNEELGWQIGEPAALVVA